MELLDIVTTIIILILFVCLKSFETGKTGTFEYIHNKNNRNHKDRVKDLKRNPRSNSENRAIKILAKVTSRDYRDFPTVLPHWLVDPLTNTTMELDGYNEELKIAMEFSGPQHYKWYPTESYDKYFHRIRRDTIKKKKCEERGICLIMLQSAMDVVHWDTYIRSRLSDCGLCERPVGYLPVIEKEPFRNYQIEEEMGLNWIV